jgi:hypothetical protein
MSTEPFSQERFGKIIFWRGGNQFPIIVHARFASFVISETNRLGKANLGGRRFCFYSARKQERFPRKLLLQDR